jgi:hypothetical protein
VVLGVEEHESKLPSQRIHRVVAQVQRQLHNALDLSLSALILC